MVFCPDSIESTGCPHFPPHDPLFHPAKRGRPSYDDRPFSCHNCRWFSSGRAGGTNILALGQLPLVEKYVIERLLHFDGLYEYRRKTEDDAARRNGTGHVRNAIRKRSGPERDGRMVGRLERIETLQSINRLEA